MNFWAKLFPLLFLILIFAVLSLIEPFYQNFRATSPCVLNTETIVPDHEPSQGVSIEKNVQFETRIFDKATIDTNLLNLTSVPEIDKLPLSIAPNVALDNVGTATSGKVFEMSKHRTYMGSPLSEILELTSNKTQDPENHFKQIISKSCKSDKWIVTTTIFEASTAVKDFDRLDHWCTVVVGDKKSVSTTEYTNELNNVIYLDVDTQISLFKNKLHMFEVIPYNHFGRKNLGFIYAIINGAKYIYDTDDDNELIDKTDIPVIGDISDTSNVNISNFISEIKQMDMKDEHCFDKTQSTHTFNIFETFAIFVCMWSSLVWCEIQSISKL